MVGKIPPWKWVMVGKILTKSEKFRHGRNKRQGGVHEGIINQVILFKFPYNKLKENAKNPKKIWQTLNEILGKAKQKEPLSQININDVPESDPTKIADHFIVFSLPSEKRFQTMSRMLRCNRKTTSIMVGTYRKWL